MTEERGTWAQRNEPNNPEKNTNPNDFEGYELPNDAACVLGGYAKQEPDSFEPPEVQYVQENAPNYYLNEEYYYDKAYEHVFSDGEDLSRALRAGQDEAEEFRNDVKGAALLPKPLLREISDSRVKPLLFSGANRLADLQHRNLTPVTKTLNATRVTLADGSDVLEKYDAKNPQALAGILDGEDPKNWPNILLVCNSNLGTPQSFMDEMTTVRDVVKKVDPETPSVVIGAFHSAGHTPANAVESMQRAKALKANGATDETGISPASFEISVVLTEILAERVDGKIRRENGKIVLRKDAADVLEHVTVAGYSGGYLAANDALRIIQNEMTKGEWLVHAPDGSLQPTGETLANIILRNANVLGISGMEVQTEVRKPWRSVNYMSLKDTSLALGGGKALVANDDTILLGGTRLLEAHFGGHGLKGMRDELLREGGQVDKVMQASAGVVR